MVTFGANLGDGVCPFLSSANIEMDLLLLFQDDVVELDLIGSDDVDGHNHLVISD